MEGWRSQANTINDKSGVTEGFGIDFSQSPYNTSKGLQENGFTREQAEAIMQTGVLGKKVKQLKKEDFDFENIKEITIVEVLIDKVVFKVFGETGKDINWTIHLRYQAASETVNYGLDP